jgi:hypothetical protein
VSEKRYSTFELPLLETRLVVPRYHHLTMKRSFFPLTVVITNLLVSMYRLLAQQAMDGSDSPESLVWKSYSALNCRLVEIRVDLLCAMSRETWVHARNIACFMTTFLLGK